MHCNKNNPLMPSNQLKALLNGEIDYYDSPGSIRSWAEFSFYNAAKKAIKSKDLREVNRLDSTLKSKVYYYINVIKRG